MTKGMALILLMCGAAACKTAAEAPSRGRQHFPIQYSYIDSPDQKRILLFYRNLSGRSVCLGPENWPENGILLNSGDQVWLEIDGKRFYLKVEQDYCPQCVNRVKSGSERNGYFLYSSFDIPLQLETSQKTLSFHPIGFSCR